MEYVDFWTIEPNRTISLTQSDTKSCKLKSPANSFAFKMLSFQFRLKIRFGFVCLFDFPRISWWIFWWTSCGTKPTAPAQAAVSEGRAGDWDCEESDRAKGWDKLFQSLTGFQRRTNICQWQWRNSSPLLWYHVLALSEATRRDWRHRTVNESPGALQRNLWFDILEPKWIKIYGK